MTQNFKVNNFDKIDTEALNNINGGNWESKFWYGVGYWSHVACNNNVYYAQHYEQGIKWG